MSYCSYFQALVAKKDTWFFVATMRSNEHLMFDRTHDAERGLFEFFVPSDNEERFVRLMHWYQEQGIITEFKKLPNRLMTEEL